MKRRLFALFGMLFLTMMFAGLATASHSSVEYRYDSSVYGPDSYYYKACFNCGHSYRSYSSYSGPSHSRYQYYYNRPRYNYPSYYDSHYRYRSHSSYDRNYHSSYSYRSSSRYYGSSYRGFGGGFSNPTFRGGYYWY